MARKYIMRSKEEKLTCLLSVVVLFPIGGRKMKKSVRPFWRHYSRQRRRCKVNMWMPAICSPITRKTGTAMISTSAGKACTF